MTYHKYGLIQAATYNAYAALINSIYADTNAGSVTETSADYGYGQATTIPTVAVGNNITAAQWTALFGKITLCGTHQGVSVSPIPSSVSTGNLITAYNEYLTTTTLTDVVSRLIANRMIVAVGDLASASQPTQTSALTWTTGLQYTFSMDFSTWDNARHYFNTGGSVVIGGAHPTGDPDNAYWSAIFTAMGSLKFTWHDTIPANGSGPGSNKGFYDLTTTYARIYQRSNTTGYPSYTNNYIAIYAKLNAAAGTNGRIDFLIQLIDNDPTPNTKTVGTQYFISNLTSTGILSTISYTGTTSFIAGSFSTIASIAYPGVPLALSMTPTTIAAVVTGGGAGTATTSSVAVTASGGTAPYTYAWTNEAGTVSFSAPTSATTTFSRVMTSGEIASGTARCTVTDSALPTHNTTYMPINWSMNSNALNDTSA
jgi:hypothetical protein